MPLLGTTTKTRERGSVGGQIFVNNSLKDFTPSKTGPSWISCLPYDNHLSSVIFIGILNFCRWKEVTAAVLESAFVNGLREDVRAELRLWAPVDLQQIMRVAQQIEDKNKAIQA